MDNALRVLYLQPAASFGGAERQAATNIPLLGDHGIEVTALVGPGPTIGRWLEERGVRDFIHCRWFPGDWPPAYGVQRLRLPGRYHRCRAEIAALVARLIRRRRIDLVFAALPFSWVAATPVARRLGVPIVWRVGGTEISAIEKRALRGFTRWWRPQLAICNGDAVAQTYGPLLRAPLAVVPNGLSPDQFFPAETGTDRQPGVRTTVGFAARLVPQKRPEDFIALAARLRSRHPDAEFLIAGDGSRLADYRRLAERSGASNVRFLGFVADMSNFYASCDILVLPSRSEGCPNVVLEALASRTCVVASDAAGTREVVRHGIEGLIYPIGDLEALKSCVGALLDDRLAMAALADRGLRRVTEQFAATACARRTSNLLHAVAGRRPRLVVRSAAASPPRPSTDSAA